MFKFIAFFVLLISSSFTYALTCEEMSKQFYLENMDGVVGQNAPDVRDRPKYIKELMSRIVTKYPNVDALQCMSDGLDAAKKERLTTSSKSITRTEE